MVAAKSAEALDSGMLDYDSLCLVAQADPSELALELSLKDVSLMKMANTRITIAAQWPFEDEMRLRDGVIHRLDETIMILAEFEAAAHEAWSDRFADQTLKALEADDFDPFLLAVSLKAAGVATTSDLEKIRRERLGSLFRGRVTETKVALMHRLSSMSYELGRLERAGASFA